MKNNSSAAWFEAGRTAVEANKLVHRCVMRLQAAESGGHLHGHAH